MNIEMMITSTDMPITRNWELAHYLWADYLEEIEQLQSIKQLQFVEYDADEVPMAWLIGCMLGEK